MDFSSLLYPLNIVYVMSTIGAFGAACLWGGRSERLLGLYGLAALVICSAADAFADGQAPPSVHLALMLPLLGGFLALALRSAVPWTLFAAAFQLLSTMVAFAAFLHPDLNYNAVATAERVWDYLLFGALSYGVWRGRAANRGSSMIPARGPAAELPGRA